MNSDKSYYQDWKLQTDPQLKEEIQFEQNAQIFFADQETQDPYSHLDPEKQRRREELLQKTQKIFDRSETMANPDKKQVGIFYESATSQEAGKEQRMKIEINSRASNSIFNPSTYSNEEWKRDVYSTTSRAEHHPDQFIGEEPDKKHNLRRTVISEYSNAIHNGTVFINPRFSSC